MPEVSGLVAVVATGDGPPVTEEEVRRLADDDEALRGSRPRTTRGGDRVRAVLFGAEGQPSTGVDPPSWRLVTGRLHADAGQAPLLRPQDADGQYAAVGYDAEGDTAVVVNDPFGMHALFVVERPGRTWVATSAMTLARHLGCRADPLGVMGVLVAGYSFGARTLWQEVRRLEPASMLVLGSGGGVERTYFRPDRDPRVGAFRLPEAVDHVRSTAVDVLRSRLGGEEHWADLTGGYDSRLLCLLLHEAGVRISTNTRAAPVPDDIDIARELAARQGWPWRDLTLPDTWPAELPDVVPTALGWGDGALEVLQLARVLAPHARLAAEGSSLLSAGGGEHLQYYAWQSELLTARRGHRPRLERWVDMIGMKPSGPDVLVAHARDEVRADFVDRFRAHLAPYDDAPAETQLELAYAYKCTGHFGAYRSADGAHLRAELPFYFRPVFEAAFSTSPRLRERHVLMRHLVARLSPAAAALRTTRGGPAAPMTPTNAVQFLPYYGVLGRKAVNKLSGALGRRPPFPSPTGFAWEPLAHASVLRSPHGAVLQDPDQLRVGALVRPERWADLVDAAVRPGFTGSAVLGRVLTVELALRATSTELPADAQSA